MQGFILWPFDLWQAGFISIITQCWSFRHWLFRLMALFLLDPVALFSWYWSLLRQCMWAAAAVCFGIHMDEEWNALWTVQCKQRPRVLQHLERLNLHRLSTQAKLDPDFICRVAAPLLQRLKHILHVVSVFRRAFECAPCAPGCDNR